MWWQWLHMFAMVIGSIHAFQPLSYGLTNPVVRNASVIVIVLHLKLDQIMRPKNLYISWLQGKPMRQHVYSSIWVSRIKIYCNCHIWNTREIRVSMFISLQGEIIVIGTCKLKAMIHPKIHRQSILCGWNYCAPSNTNPYNYDKI